MKIKDLVTNEELSQLDEKASRKLCLSSAPNQDLGASNLIGHRGSSVRVTVGGKKIKGQKYGGPLPDYGTRKGQ